MEWEKENFYGEKLNGQLDHACWITPPSSKEEKNNSNPGYDAIKYWN